MKALCVKQPWANLIACGFKTIETRTWSTNYRGELLIVSSKKVDNQAARQLAGVLERLGMICDAFPTGVAVCHSRLVDCRPMAAADEPLAFCPVYPAAWSWVLEDIVPISGLFPVRGRLGLFEVEIP